MSLVTYEETRPWAKSIKQRVVTRNMPPWHLDKTVGIQQFQNDMSLSDEQIAMIARWVDAGAPLGDPKDMPPPKQWPNDDGWQLAQAVRTSPISSQVGALHDAGARAGRVVQAADANSGHRASLGARRRDAAGDLGRAQDHPPRARVPPAGRTGQPSTRTRQRRAC